MSWQTGGLIVGALAVVYGMVVAFGIDRLDRRTRSLVVNGGAVLLLVAMIVLFLLPLLGVF